MQINGVVDCIFDKNPPMLTSPSTLPLSAEAGIPYGVIGRTFKVGAAWRSDPGGAATKVVAS
jgi:hypothetical protein